MATRKPAKTVSKIKKKGLKKVAPKAKAKKAVIPKVKKKLSAGEKLKKQRAALSKGTRTKEGQRRTTLGDIKKKKKGLGATLKGAIKEATSIKARATKGRDRDIARKDARNPGGAKKYRVIGSGARERGVYDRPTASRFKPKKKMRKSLGIAKGKRN